VTYLLFALGFVALVKGANLLLLAAMFLGRRHVLDRWEGGCSSPAISRTSAPGLRGWRSRSRLGPALSTCRYTKTLISIMVSGYPGA
jgi:hypothetical protein